MTLQYLLYHTSSGAAPTDHVNFHHTSYSSSVCHYIGPQLGFVQIGFAACLRKHWSNITSKDYSNACHDLVIIYCLLSKVIFIGLHSSQTIRAFCSSKFAREIETQTNRKIKLKQEVLSLFTVSRRSRYITYLDIFCLYIIIC